MIHDTIIVKLLLLLSHLILGWALGSSSWQWYTPQFVITRQENCICFFTPETEFWWENKAFTNENAEEQYEIVPTYK